MKASEKCAKIYTNDVEGLFVAFNTSSVVQK